MAAAQAFADALLAATRTGFSNTAAFYAPDAHQDLRLLNDFQGVGRATIVQGARDFQQMPPRAMGGWDQSDAHEATRVEPVFLGRDDLLDVRSIPTCGYTIADRVALGDDGIIEESMAGSMARAESFHVGWAALAEPVAQRYVEAWASGSATAVAQLYAPDAVLADSLRGVRAGGRTAIAALAAADASGGGLPRARMQAEAPAIYLLGGFAVNGPLVAGLDGLTLLLHIGAPGGDVLAVDLDLDVTGRIRREERLHRIDRLGAVGAPAVPARGWWSSAQIPAVPMLRRSADQPMAPGDIHPIAVWNGDPRIDPIIAWARERFAAAGLAPPRPASLTFLPAVAGDRWATYGFATGTDAIDLGLPFTADEACVDVACSAWRATAKAAILHELAHLWSTSGPKSFRSRTTGSWGPSGAERAAETIAWGLMDEPYRVDPRLGAPSCVQLTADFEALTNTTPLGRDCLMPAATP
jgi:hypothetical protein